MVFVAAWPEAWPTAKAPLLEHHSVVAQVARGRAVDMGVGLAVVEDAEANAGDDEVSGTVGKRGGAVRMGEIGVHRRVAEVEARQRDEERGRIRRLARLCGQVRLDRFARHVLDVWLNTIRYVLPGAHCAGHRNQRDLIALRVISELIILVERQQDSVLIHRDGVGGHRAVIDSRSIVGQLNAERGERFVADHGDGYGVESRIEIESRLVVQRIGQRAGQGSRHDALDGAGSM